MTRRLAKGTPMWQATGIVTGALLLTAHLAVGSGFEVRERSVEGLGKSFAGATAGYSDGSAAFFNPAAMPWIESHTLTAGAHVIVPRADFTDEGSRYPTGAPITGGTDDGGAVAIVPNAYLVSPCSDALAFGLAVNTPFGLATEWDSDWVGRYHALDTDLLTLNISPSVAWRLHKRLALGVGVSAVYFEAELSNAINFGTIAAQQLPPPANAAFSPGSADGYGNIKGDDWGYGYTLGLAFVPCEQGRLGLSYRSKVDATLEGDATFDVPPALAPAFQPMGLFVDTTGSADLTLPESVNLGYVHDVGDALQFAFDVGWTRWSRFEELRVDFGSNQPDSVTEEDWEDTWNVALGLSYAMNDTLTLRSGIAFDETPVPDPAHRTPRIPDGDRTWLSVGCGVKAADHLRLDVAYAHIFVSDGETAALSSTSDAIIGEYDSNVNIVSLQGVLTF